MSIYNSISAKLNLAIQELESSSNQSSVIAGQNSTHPELLVETWLHQRNSICASSPNGEKSIFLIFYIFIIIVSLFGNSIVCKIVFGYPAVKSTTNLFIGNLSISDIMMTVINIPLMLTGLLSQNWPLGIVFCKSMPFFQALSVNVSTLTMTLIAYDRFQVIAYPLKPRPQYCKTVIKIISVWITAMALSSPYPLMSKLERGLSCAKFVRCRLVYPTPRVEFRRFFSIVASVIQYVIPLTYCTVIYLKLCTIIWQRRSVGVVMKHQKERLRKEKWKTIRMLIIVLVVFAVCWLPLNVYHTYQDMRGEVDYQKHKSNIWLFCHLFAMSSVCYNPFIYCWLNDTFRKVAMSHLKWLWGTRQMKCRHITLNSDSGDIKTRTESRNTSLFSKSLSFNSNPQDSSYIVDVSHLSDLKLLNENDIELNSNFVLEVQKTTSLETCVTKQAKDRKKGFVDLTDNKKYSKETYV